MLSNKNCTFVSLVKKENLHPEPHDLFLIDSLLG